MFMKKISCDELKVLLQDSLKPVAIIDVREDFEVEEGMIPGALHYPMSRFLDNPLPENDIYVFYCRSGYRSAVAAEHVIMQQASKNIYNLVGGINAWIVQGFELQKVG